MANVDERKGWMTRRRLKGRNEMIEVRDKEESVVSDRLIAYAKSFD